VNFVRLGLGPGMASTHFLPCLGPQRAARLLLTGEAFTGAQAVEWGLALSSVPTSEVLPTAVRLAAEIASSSKQAVRVTLRSLRVPLQRGLDAALQREAEGQALTYPLDDLKEGLRAVREKRAPKFS